MSDMQNPMDDSAIYNSAAMVYGEVGNKDARYQDMAISAFLNSIGKNEWKNLTPNQILEKRFYAVSKKNDPYTWAITKKFPNKEEENKFKRIYARTAAAIKSGKPAYDNQFYFTKGEITRLKNSKGFNFDLLEPASTPKIGKYSLFKYKTKPVNNRASKKAKPTQPDYGFGKRADGTQKGLGYFGVLKRPDGNISTELSIGVTFDGKKMEIPSLVPTLTKEEIQYLLQGNKPTKAIIKKAVEYARMRISQGKSPFAQAGEQKSR